MTFNMWYLNMSFLKHDGNLNVEQKYLEEQRDGGWWCNWWVEGDYGKLMNPRGLNLPSGQNTASRRGDFNKTLEQKRVLMCVFEVLGFENENSSAVFSNVQLRSLCVRPTYKLQISVKK